MTVNETLRVRPHRKANQAYKADDGVEIRQLDAAGQLSGISGGTGAPLMECAYDATG
jgi:hypothetical protein